MERAALTNLPPADAEIGTGDDIIVPSSVPDDGAPIVMGPSTMHEDDPSLADSCKL